MMFPFDIAKASDVASEFLQREGGTMNILKLVKLVYLLDRLSIDRRGIPVVGGAYFSLPNGPITSELLDLINAGRLCGSDDSSWEERIGDRQNHEVALQSTVSSEHLSSSEIDLLDEIYREHGAKGQWELVEWTHRNCPEWTSLLQGRDLIPVERIAEAVGKSDPEVQRVREEALEQRFLAGVFQGS